MSSPAKSPKAEWRRPSEIMKLHRRKRKSIGVVRNSRKDAATSQTALADSTNYRVTSGKRQNPFGCNTSDVPKAKKQNVSSREGDSEEDRSVDIQNEDIKQHASCKLFEALDNTDKDAERELQMVQKQKQLERPKTEDIFRSPNLIIQEERTKVQRVEVKAQTGWESDTTLPQDYCLKQKVRFISPKSFSWCCTLKSLEEAQGINDFITRHQDPVSDLIDREAGKEFQRCIMYWIHPNLPWIKLFPRLTGDNNRVSRPSLMTTDDEVLTALRTDWAESFTSAFYMVRAGYSPYFYLCAHQFTAVFLRSGDKGQRVSGILTPTTRGFREALTNEGIEFTMPLLEKKKTESEVQSETNSAEQKVCSTVDEELDHSDDAAASVWLESIGLNKANFPSLDPNKVKIQRESYKVIDNLPQSLVHVEGSDIQALFNFILNWRSCVASSGPQTGIPPTILSPVGFRGASLKSLKVKQSSVKQEEDGVVRFYGALEISGPVLPHNLQSLCKLFKSTQDGHFTATCHNHETTAPFNAALQNTTADECSENNKDLNRSQSNQTFPSVNSKTVSGSAIKELEYSNDKFFFKS